MVDDTRVRTLVRELIESSPPPPPFKSHEATGLAIALSPATRPRRLVLIVALVAVVAGCVLVSWGLLARGGDTRVGPAGSGNGAAQAGDSGPWFGIVGLPTLNADERLTLMRRDEVLDDLADAEEPSEPTGPWTGLLQFEFSGVAVVADVSRSGGEARTNVPGLGERVVINGVDALRRDYGTVTLLAWKTSPDVDVAVAAPSFDSIKPLVGALTIDGPGKVLVNGVRRPVEDSVAKADRVVLYSLPYMTGTSKVSLQITKAAAPYLSLIETMSGGSSITVEGRIGFTFATDIGKTMVWQVSDEYVAELVAPPDIGDDALREVASSVVAVSERAWINAGSGKDGESGAESEL